MKKWRYIFTAALLASAMFVTQAFAVPVSDLRDDKAEAEAELDNLEANLDNVIANLAYLEAELVETGEKIIKTREDLLIAQAKEETQYDDMKLRIVAMYESGNGSLVQKILEAESMGELLVQAEYVQAINEYDRKKLAEYIENKNRIATMKNDLESYQSTLQASQESYSVKKSQVENLIAEKEQEIDDFTDKIADAVAQAAANRVPSGSGDITGNYTPPTNSGGGQAIVDEAYKYLGVPYVWGGASASGVDCSGLVLLSHRAIGVSLPHYSGSIGSSGQRVPSMSQALPGDVVCYVGHVGIYVGGGMMIHAPQTGDVVRVVPVYGSPWFRRYW